MVTQRSLSFDEVTTDWILFLDDDVYLPKDGVEKLFQGIAENNGDAIYMGIRNKCTLKSILMKFLTGARPHKSNIWGTKIHKGGRFSYNINPPHSVLLSQSGFGPCGLVKKSVYKAIHFEDERWQEKIGGYCLGDDQLFYNKMYLMGYKVLVHYDSGIQHLDASISCEKDDRLVHKQNVTQLYLVWHRTSYQLSTGLIDKISRVLAFSGIQILGFILKVIQTIKKRKTYLVPDYIKGIIDGYKFTKTEVYKRLPRFVPRQ
jgi:glycosyltransferase involved in cell wall biosynthesis